MVNRRRAPQRFGYRVVRLRALRHRDSACLLILSLPFLVGLMFMVAFFAFGDAGGPASPLSKRHSQNGCHVLGAEQQSPGQASSTAR